jgi:hypothetical protein
MKSTFSGQIRFVRFFGGFKIPEPMRLAFVRYVCAPLVLKKYNSHETRLVAPVWFSDVLRIARFVYNSKVGKSVIVLNAINMVNKALGPFAGHVQPCQSMRFVNGAFVANGAVANAFFAAPRYVAFSHALGRAYFPRKDARIWTVGQNFAKFIDSHLCISSIVSKYIYPKTIGGQA